MQFLVCTNWILALDLVQYSGVTRPFMPDTRIACMEPDVNTNQTFPWEVTTNALNCITLSYHVGIEYSVSAN